MSKEKEPEHQVYEFGGCAYLSGSDALVKLMDSSDFITDIDVNKKSIIPVNNTNQSIDFVPRGNDDQLPLNIVNAIASDVTVGSNIEFNTRVLYGDGIMVVKRFRNDDGEIEIKEQLPSEQPEIFQFLEDNNINYVNREIANDLAIFSDSYVELTFNKDKENPKIVRLCAKETMCSRISVIDEKTKKSEWHGYGITWGGKNDDITVTPLLDRQSPLLDLKQRRGITPNEEGLLNNQGENRFILNLNMTTPGRFYYNKAYWWTIFKSGWFDFAIAIPALKKALIKNQMVLKYMVYINKSFWPELYKHVSAVSDEDKIAARKQFLTNMDKFLSTEENAGKSFVSEFEYDMIKGVEKHYIIIKPLESFLKGGEYIEDSEEVSNMICYAMGVHPSIIGASPGKSKSINGTEARELFLIHQALCKPLQDEILFPLYVVKAINKWPADIFFTIPNMQLTTLDKGTGATKNIGMPDETTDKKKKK